jgi:hypothetical protein
MSEQGEVERLSLELEGVRKAYNLLHAGMGSQCELMDELKQRVRSMEKGYLDLPTKAFRRLLGVPEDFPTIVTLCGSTRFVKEYEEVQKRLTLEGKLVISVGLFGHQIGLDMEGPTKKMLDELHKRKIDLADEVYVIDPVVLVCGECRKISEVGRHTVSEPLYGAPGSIARTCYSKCHDRAMVPVPYVGESTSSEIKYANVKGKRVRYLSEEK